MSDGPIIDIQLAAKNRRNDTLRRDTALAYISDPKCDSLAKLAQDSRFTGKVSLRTLERWCAEDRWPAARQNFLAETYKDMRQRMADTLTQALCADVQMLIEARDRARLLLMDETVRPKSFEGLLKSFVDLSRRIEEIASEAGDRLVPGGLGAQGADENQVTDVPADELDAMAQAALKHRRGELESAIHAMPLPEDEDL
jgi:hypothetical protein